MTEKLVSCRGRIKVEAKSSPVSQDQRKAVCFIAAQTIDWHKNKISPPMICAETRLSMHFPPLLLH